MIDKFFPKKMRVKVPTRLRIRVEPSLTGRAVASFANNTLVEVGRRVDTTDGVWYQVEAYYTPKVEYTDTAYPMKHLKEDLYSRIEVRRERWVYAKYLRRIHPWQAKRFKLYG